MATKISDIYDKCIDICAATLSNTYFKLPNPYSLTSNSHLQLRNAYGVAVGPGRDTERYIGCLVTWERTFSIILVQQVIATQNDLTLKEAIDKTLLDDHDKLRKAFYLNSTLDQLAIKSTVLSDGGVDFADGAQKFLFLQMDLFVEYQEDPNT